MFRLAHLSDLHATSVRFPRLDEVSAKRLLGLLSWQLRRRHEHRGPVLEALLADLTGVAPDHVAITGDLTNLGLASEHAAAVSWLERMGGEERVSVVPGNHDAYAPGAREGALSAWDAYVRGDGAPGAAGSGGGFPTVRVRGPVALVGVDSARATPLGFATGSVGATQLARLGEILGKLGVAGLCRIVLIHHPPHGRISPRRALTDAAALRETLAAAGAELVLHGHMHRRSLERLPGPSGPIPVVGVPSSSAVGRRPGRRAQYHVYRIDRGGAADGRRFVVSVSVRGLDPASGRFVAEGEETL